MPSIEKPDQTSLDVGGSLEATRLARKGVSQIRRVEVLAYKHDTQHERKKATVKSSKMQYHWLHPISRLR
jgi:hypothetical protein